MQDQIHSIYFIIEKMSKKKKIVYNNFYILFIDLLSAVARQQSELQKGYTIMQSYRDEKLENEKKAFDKQQQQNDMIEKLNFEITQLKTSLIQADQNIQNNLQPKIQELEGENERIKQENQIISKIKAERDRFSSELESFHETYRVNMKYLENKKIELEQNLAEKMKLLKEMSETINQLKSQKKSEPNPYTVSSNLVPGFSTTDETFLTLTEHNYRIKTFERAQSVLVAEKMELNDLKIKYESEILNLRALLEESYANIEELKKKCDETNVDCEIYKIQAMTYQEDFAEERKMRERLANEIDNLKNPK